MRRFATIAASILLAAVASPAFAGVQVTTCDEIEPGVLRYTFFACAPNIDANDLHIQLTAGEINQGEQIVGCGVPNLPGFSCNSNATSASYFFPTIGPFDCVPNLPGDINKFVIDIATGDGLTVVQEIWTLDGVQVAGFISVVACPPISVEDETWGRIKALYR
jgi:hypothetical protein